MRRRSSSSPNDRQGRAVVFGVLGLIVFSVLVGRLFTLQMVHGERALVLSEKNWLKPEPIPGRRGRILDRSGKILADVVPSFSIVFDPQHEAFKKKSEYKEQVLNELAVLLNHDPKQYEDAIYRNRGRSYHPIRIHRGANEEEVSRVEENRPNLPGVSVEVDSERFYPHGSLAAHTLGYLREVNEKDLKKDETGHYRPGSKIGRAGLERVYEKELRGTDGVKFIEVNVRGRRSQAYIEAEPVPPEEGSDIRLTLDLDLQKATELALDNAPFDGDGQPPVLSGAAIVLDVRTGDVLAVASRPAYDPNVFSRSMSHAEAGYLFGSSRPMFNRAVQGKYPPASTFKPVVMYGVLDAKLTVPSDDYVYCSGRHKYGNRVFRCWKRTGHGHMNSFDSMAQSCDTYFYKAAEIMGVTGIRAVSERFRVYEKTGIDLPGEKAGLVPTPKWYDENYGSWSRGVALNLSIGQGEIEMTPLQMVTLTAAVANKGKRPKPHLLAEVNGVQAEIEFNEPLELDERIMRTIREALEFTVTDGTAKVVNFEEVKVAAKTGTAENSRGEDHAAFVAYAPADNPEIALVVYLEHWGHGGAAAGPVGRDILMAYFGIEPEPDPEAMPAPASAESQPEVLAGESYEE
ncbi:MAG: penicillin-binding protein 2 [Candidatus Eisenbacteria bacterium]|uniref:Penicillin-binding protein 2 n=1 Tax=Eiseniibacteriota bacterium TaxID=2212470 RepID=A0A7Y2E9Y7_UNCEI|nr:penicillin-binding protein 2 [Candidatus Eisenbacteria bacterium]